jgi:preprotein translocase subunit SecE
MPTEEDVKPKTLDEVAPPEGASEQDLSAPGGPGGDALAKLDPTQGEHEGEQEEEEGLAPTQLGTQRFVFAAYFAAGITIAFLLSKFLSYAWSRLAIYKPQLGEPHEEIVMPLAGLVGLATAIYYYRDPKTRTLAEEVASELGQVTWPNRDEVVNSTFVVIITTLVATTFFALMDRFWGFVTNLVYGA